MIITTILNHACPRPRPVLPQALQQGRLVEIGKAYRMDQGMVPDDWTGVVGRVVRVCADGDVELETRRGGVFIHYSRLQRGEAA